MIRDYSSRFPSVVRDKQKVWGKRPIGSKGNGKVTKIIGLVVTMAMITGVAMSFWFGWLVKNGLDELASSQAKRQELQTLNGKLIARRDQLLSRDKIEAAAKQLGLYPPSAEQTRRP